MQREDWEESKTMLLGQTYPIMYPSMDLQSPSGQCRHLQVEISHYRRVLASFSLILKWDTMLGLVGMLGDLSEGTKCCRL